MFWPTTHMVQPVSEACSVRNVTAKKAALTGRLSVTPATQSNGAAASITKGTTMKMIKNTYSRKTALVLIAAGVILFSLTLTGGNATAQTPLHPTFPFLDADGGNVLDSGKPVSTMQTCGQCHNTEFIANHSFHVDAGSSNQPNQEEPAQDVPGYQRRSLR